MEPAPDEIAWNVTSDAGLGKEEINGKKLWDHFTDMSDKKSTKAILVYFYWPEEDNDNEDIQNMVRRCKLMDKILEEEAIRRASVKFHCFKCSFKDMSEELKKKYKLTVVPKVLFFDVRGKKVWQLTSTKASAEGVAGKMEKIAAACQKILEKDK